MRLRQASPARRSHRPCKGILRLRSGQWFEARTGTGFYLDRRQASRRINADAADEEHKCHPWVMPMEPVREIEPRQPALQIDSDQGDVRASHHHDIECPTPEGLDRRYPRASSQAWHLGRLATVRESGPKASTQSASHMGGQAGSQVPPKRCHRGGNPQEKIEQSLRYPEKV